MANIHLQRYLSAVSDLSCLLNDRYKLPYPIDLDDEIEIVGVGLNGNNPVYVFLVGYFCPSPYLDHLSVDPSVLPDPILDKLSEALEAAVRKEAPWWDCE